MRRTRLISIAAIIAATTVALAACSSSGNKAASSSTPNTGTTTSATTTTGSTAPASTKCGSGKLTADGSTAQQNAVNAWIKAYATNCPGAQVNYAGTGSGQGITDFTTGKVDFAGSDAALDPTQGQMAAATKECGSPALDLPMVVGPIAVAYKVSGVSTLVLTPDVIAKIFTGKITNWNDAAIKALNASANLPATKITVFFRSDSSGTTQNFERYLNGNDPTDYPTKPSKTWTGVGQGKTGSAGVESAISSTEGSIGYLEWSYAGSGGLSMAQINNGGGPVSLTAQTAGAAVAAATPASQGGSDLTLKLDYATKTPGAYPIILVTYEIVCSKYSSSTVGANVKAFLSYTSSAAGQALLPSVGSAPLPTAILTQVQTAVAAIS